MISSAVSQLVSPIDRLVAALPPVDLSTGAPALVGCRCRACGMVMIEQALACPACTRRDTLEPCRLSQRGSVHSFTVVHRSFPGIATPFVAVVVDLDNGGTLKGTLIGADDDPQRLVKGQRVSVLFRETGQTDADGKSFLSYVFVPQEHPDE